MGTPSFSLVVIEAKTKTLSLSKNNEFRSSRANLGSRVSILTRALPRCTAWLGERRPSGSFRTVFTETSMLEDDRPRTRPGAEGNHIYFRKSSKKDHWCYSEINFWLQQELKECLSGTSLFLEHQLSLSITGIIIFKSTNSFSNLN